MTSSSTSYDYPSYSGSARQRIVDEEDDDQVAEEEPHDEETDRSSRTSRRRKGPIDIPDRRKCPDCDGEETFDPETGNGECSECHGTGLEPDPLEAFTKALRGTRQNCPACGGEKTCQTCGGKGYIKD